MYTVSQKVTPQKRLTISWPNAYAKLFRATFYPVISNLKIYT